MGKVKFDFTPEIRTVFIVEYLDDPKPAICENYYEIEMARKCRYVTDEYWYTFGVPKGEERDYSGFGRKTPEELKLEKTSHLSSPKPDGIQ